MDMHRAWVEERYFHGWAKGCADEQVKIFRREDFAYHTVGVVFWQTDGNDRPTTVTEPYEKAFTAANVAKEQDFYCREPVSLSPTGERAGVREQPSPSAPASRRRAKNPPSSSRSLPPTTPPCINIGSFRFFRQALRTPSAPVPARRATDPPYGDTTALERGIDRRVHRLYGLTVEDTRLVAESARSNPSGSARQRGQPSHSRRRPSSRPKPPSVRAGSA